MEKLPLHHAVVIATLGRPELYERALPSVKAQSRAPDEVLICVDAEEIDSLTKEVQDAVASLQLPFTVRVFRRDRIAGASGAWNTALDKLAREPRDPHDVVVSFLDDDDSWEPTHLEAVHAAMVAHVEVVATPIVRFDAEHPEGMLIEPPATLEHAEFLVKNPGIQGSNLSARLSVLLLAGLFDEALKSTTDRDLCIRFADLGVGYSATNGGRIRHYAAGVNRLSTPGCEAKQTGLSTFHAKHGWRMRPAEERAFLERATTLFGFTPEPPKEIRAAQSERKPRTTEAIALVVGAIVDSDKPEKALGLVSDLARLVAHARVESLVVVLLQNGGADGFSCVVEAGRAAGLCLRVVDEAACLAIEPGLGIEPDELVPHKSIAVARTILQRFVFHVAREEKHPIAWIIDDDLRLPANLDLLVDDVARAQSEGFDVAIGMVEGAPPIPAATALRTQLVDLVSFLRGAVTRGADAAMPDPDVHNERWKRDRRDYYYDLNRRVTDRLETPFLPRTGATTVGPAVAEIAARCTRMLAGEQLFRPVEVRSEDPIADAKDSTFRGGNTFVFDIDLLRDVPNLSPRVEGRRVRRSDMLWATLAKLQHGKIVKQLPIVVQHDRSRDEPQGMDVDKLFDDVVGYAFARAVADAKFRPGSVKATGWNDTVRKEILKRTKKFARERFAELALSCFRIRGLARALLHLLDTSSFFDDPTAIALRSFATTLQREFSVEALRSLEKRVTHSAEDHAAFRIWFDVTAQCERVSRARRVAEERTSRRADVVLGMGSEGVVFRSDDRVIKVLDCWSDEDRRDHLAPLHALVGRDSTGALPRVFDIHDASDPIVVEMEWQPNSPYHGGHGPALVALLRALRRADLSYTNIHPKNLRVTQNGLRIVDVGRSIVPYSAEMEEHAARRALLSMRHASDPELDELLRRSIEDGSFSELAGVEHLLAAVRDDDPKAALDVAVTSAIHRNAPTSILDYGCGKPRRVKELAGHATLVAFDPAMPALALRWTQEAPDVERLDEPALDRLLEQESRFDAVLCSLVLCTLDEAAMKHALSRLRRLVRADGTAVVAVCDPRGAMVENTTRHRRLLPRDARERHTFCYAKHVLGAGTRTEHHRPLSDYRRAFFDAGFIVHAEEIIEGVDTDRFTRTPEFVLFELSPRHEAKARARLHRDMPRAPLAGLTVLSYHRIDDGNGIDPAMDLHRKRNMVVAKSTFTHHMRDLARLFEPIGLEDVHHALTGRCSLPRRAAWITFDDGYRELLSAVMPMMTRERLPSTAFTRLPGRDGLPSWAPLDLVYQVLARATVPEAKTRLPTGSSRELLLAKMYIDQIREGTALGARYGVDLRSLRREDLYLSQTNQRELVASGFSLGAHGEDHVRWTNLADHALERELAACADWLGAMAPSMPLFVAYPDASVDHRVALAAARNGFQGGVILEARAPEDVDASYGMTRLVARDELGFVEELAKRVEAI